MSKKINITSFLMLTFFVLLVSCDSSKTGENSDPDPGVIFVSENGSSGSIGLSADSMTLGIGDTTNFTVSVRDLNGGPVRNSTVTCDTELGLSLLDPSTGSSISDDFGNVSGVVGCTQAGSFRLGCRVPFGGNRRVFKTIKCEGIAPPGFAGFTGAGGGTLGSGGGVTPGDDQDESNFVVRITSVDFSDGNQPMTLSIDTIQNGDCDGEADSVDPEVFTDTVANFTVSNETSQVVRFSSYRYRALNWPNSGSNFTSNSINFIGEVEIPANGGTGSFAALFADASNGQKFFFGSADPIGIAGFLNVEFILTGQDLSGETVTVTARTSASFGNFNRCTG